MVEAMLTDLSEDDRARLGAMLELVRGNLARSLEPEVVAHG
jgi:hypothetical protein